MKFNKLIAATLTTAALSFGGIANAAILVTSGNVGGGDTSNVLFKDCTASSPVGVNTLQGCLNDSPSTLVNFTANEAIVAPAKGQARIEAADEIGYQALTISLAALNTTFAKLVLNINAATDGLIYFVGTPDGETIVQKDLKAGGNNFFTITGEDFSKVFFSTSGVDIVTDVRQVRLGGIGANEVPEPASLALLGLGLIGIGAARRFRKADKA